MANISQSTLYDWTDGQTVDAAKYKLEREILRVAINDNDDAHETHVAKVLDPTSDDPEREKHVSNRDIKDILSRISTNEGDIVTLEGIDADTSDRITNLQDNLQQQLNQQGLKDADLQQQISDIISVYSTDAERLAAISQVVADYEMADDDLTALINNKIDKARVYTKEEIDSITLGQYKVLRFENRVVTDAETDSLLVGIPQYDPALDDIDVHVGGVYMTEGQEYEITTAIDGYPTLHSLQGPYAAGTIIDMEVEKNYRVLDQGDNVSGSLIQDGTITVDKLTDSLRNLFAGDYKTLTTSAYKQLTSDSSVTLINVPSYQPDKDQLQVFIGGDFATEGVQYQETTSSGLPAIENLEGQWSNGTDIDFVVIKNERVVTPSDQVDGSVYLLDSSVSKAKLDGLLRKQLDDITEVMEDMALNVRSFGAKGDGVTDDTAALQDALDYALSESINGRAVSLYFPSGHYIISDTLTFHRTEDGSVDLKLHGGGVPHGALIEQTDTTKYVLDVSTTSGNLRGFTIEDVALMNNGGTILRMEKCQYNYFYNVAFRICDKAIEFVSCGMNTFQNCWFYYIYENLCTFGGNSAAYGTTFFQACQFGEEYAGFRPEGVTDVSFEDCYFHWILGVPVPDATDGSLCVFDLKENAPCRVAISNCRFDDMDAAVNTFLYTSYGTQQLSLKGNTVLMNADATFLLNRYQHVGYSLYEPKIVVDNYVEFDGNGNVYTALNDADPSYNWRNSVLVNNVFRVPDTFTLNMEQALLDDANNNTILHNRMNTATDPVNDPMTKIEPRTSDPASPVIGQIWLRTDL